MFSNWNTDVLTFWMLMSSAELQIPTDSTVCTPENLPLFFCIKTPKKSEDENGHTRPN